MDNQNTIDWNKIFWFACGVSFFIFAYLFGVTFWHVENSKYADYGVPFLLGTGFGGILGAVLPHFVKKPAGTSNSDNPASTPNVPTPEPSSTNDQLSQDKNDANQN